MILKRIGVWWALGAAVAAAGVAPRFTRRKLALSAGLAILPPHAQ